MPEEKKIKINTSDSTKKIVDKKDVDSKKKEKTVKKTKTVKKKTITKKPTTKKSATKKTVVKNKVEADETIEKKSVKMDDVLAKSEASIDLSEKKEIVEELIDAGNEIIENESESKNKTDSIDLRNDELENKIYEADINLKDIVSEDVKEKDDDSDKIDLRGDDEEDEEKNDDENETDNETIDLNDKSSVMSIKPLSENSPEDIKDDDEEEKKCNRPVGVYRKMAYFFIFLVILLAAAVFYLTFVKVTITIIPSYERVSSEMLFDVYNKKTENLSERAMSGLVSRVTIEHMSFFDATGIEVIGKDATGKAVIINNYNKNQPLVATTRLLAPDGELFRIRETVNVPAGGSVEVEIYADKPRADMYVGPTKFTIPGLWAGLQDQVFAETKEEITYKQQVKKHITEVDIDNSVKNLRLQFEEVVKQKIEEKYKEYSKVIYEVDKNSIENTVEGEVDDEIDEFEVKMSADVIIVAFDKRKAAKLAEQKFSVGLDENKELINFDSDGIQYVVSDYSKQDGVVTLKAVFEGRISLKGGSTIINKKEILGLDKEQIEVYISSKDEVAGVDIKFYPPFITKIPRFIELGRIQINIKK
ncbi:hypothetical protein KAI92_05405 [Candidatus Parcubacteria bacterium]|nr:hypothetical protein [Candidatus Parcubacteria bacterium]